MTRGATLSSPWFLFSFQEIVHANAYIKTAADLETKYRKNVQYNLGAMSATDSESHQTSDT
jgi:hypothetical protein